MSGIEGILGVDVETQQSENFMKSVKVILMMTASNGEYGISSEHLLQPGKTSRGGTRLHQIALSAKGVHGNPQTTCANAKTKDYSLKTDRRTQLLRTASTYNSLKMEKSSQCLHETFITIFQFLWCEKKTLYGVTKENVKGNTVARPLTYYLSCIENMLGKWWHRICGTSQ